jgi:hypothetical protein
MRWGIDALKGIETLAAEGRVTERGKPLAPDLAAPAGPAADVDEAAFQAAVNDLFRKSGWTVYHTHNSKRSDKGFPDTWAAKGRIIYAELKTEQGKLTPDQLRYRDAIRAAGGEWYCWRPSDWDQIRKVAAS